MNNGLLPPNASPQEVALSESTARIGSVPVPLRATYNPDTYAANLLPWLAWAVSVDEWNPAWSETQQRQAIKNSYYIHQHKGTIGALNSAFAALGYDLSVVEWFNKSPIGAPYTFGATIIVDQTGITTLDAFNQIISVANATKNVRSKMTGVDIIGKTNGTLYTGGVAYCGETVSIGAYTP